MGFDAKFMAELRQHYAEMHARNEKNRQDLAQWRPAEASQGKVNTFGPDEDFFGDMEKFRRDNMGTGFEQSETNKHRTLGSVGQSAEAFSDGNYRDEQFRPGNNDPNDRHPAIGAQHGSSVFDDRASPSNVLNRNNEAGHSGLDSVNDDNYSEPARWMRQGSGRAVPDADGIPPGGAAHSWVKNYPAAGRGLVRGGAKFYGK